MQYNIARDILVLRNYPLLIWNPSLTRAPLYFLATLIWHLPQGYLWKYHSKAWVGYVRSSLSHTHFFTLLIMVPCCQRRHPTKPRLGKLGHCLQPTPSWGGAADPRRFCKSSSVRRQQRKDLLTIPFLWSWNEKAN